MQLPEDGSEALSVMKNIHEMTQNILSRNGVSLREHFLMCSVGYRILLPPEELIQTSARLNGGDPRGQFTLAEYMQALHVCIQKNWFQVITEESHEQEMNRRRASQMPEIFDSGFAPGIVDFTETGYFLHRQIIVDIYGIEHIQYGDSGWNIDEIHQEVHIYAPTKELCIKRVEELKHMPSNYVGRQIQDVVVSTPEPIGRWRPNRFISLPLGFFAVMQYQLYDDNTL